MQCAGEGHHALPLSLYMRLLAPQVLRADEPLPGAGEGVQGAGEAAPQGESPQGDSTIASGPAQTASSTSQPNAEAGHSRTAQDFPPWSVHPALALHRLEKVQADYERRHLPAYALTCPALIERRDPAAASHADSRSNSKLEINHLGAAHA